MLNKVSDLIVDIARKEDLILRRVGKGVLHLPELAFTYAVGREMALQAERIFGTDKVRWMPETTITSESGRTDLVFDSEAGKGIAIEFKIGGSVESYKRDIEKLQNISPNKYETIFCALIDAWPNQLENDSRVAGIEAIDGVERICRDKFFDFFASLDDNYAKQICCIVGVWSVHNKNS